MSKELQRSILDHFFQVGRHMRQLHADAGIGSEGLTLHQVQALFCIKHQQPMRMSQLAEELRVNPGTATILVDRLVESGWLSRVQPPDDRRTVLLELSASANQKFELIINQRIEHASRLFDHLTEDELSQLDHLMAKLEKSL